MLIMRDRQKYNDYHKKYQLDRYHRRRKQILVDLGGKCVECESTESLEIDHIDYTDKSFSVAKMWSKNEKDFQAEMAKCQLLCKKHHIAKTSREDKTRRPLTHGKEWAARKHKCQCEPCLDFIKRSNTERSARRKSKPL
jgi:hypothetical protein